MLVTSIAAGGIGHLLLAIWPKMGHNKKITSEITGYFAEKLEFAAAGVQ
ncbi:MAG: hypothetical protein J7639_02960 [Paenibacillaceae bacterium]|nr:hypothetical protein [Paenibacillaceae bacterium]